MADPKDIRYDNSPKVDDNPATNPSHIGRYPAGYKRTEESARRKDELAEASAQAAEDAGSIKPDALNVENEIAQYLDPTSGNWEITNRIAGRHYVGVHRDNITINQYRTRGFKPVQGDDPEAMEYRGQDAAGGSTLRGLGDCILMWCPEEIHQQWEERDLRLRIASGAVSDEGGPEIAWEDMANDPRSASFQRGAMAHARRSDPKLQSTIFRGTAGQVENLNRGLKEGSIPNFEGHMRRP